ncbi:hypothetical protein HAX54_052101, partial [Datura stramonium]|nr:hypothetical protein [Datura stramonium]
PKPPLVEIIRFGAFALTVLKRVYKGKPRPPLVEIVCFGAFAPHDFKMRLQGK